MLVTLLGERGGWHVERLAEAFGRHGHTVEVVSWQAVGAAVGAGGLRFAPDALATADVVAVRGMPGIGSGSQRLEEVIFRMDALAQLEAAGTPVVNTPRALEIAIDKYLSLALLARAGIRVPETTIVQGEASARRAWEQLGGSCVAKPLFGSRGRGISRVTSDLEAAAIGAGAWRISRSSSRTVAGTYGCSSWATPPSRCGGSRRRGSGERTSPWVAGLRPSRCLRR